MLYIDVSPVAFTIGLISVSWYGIMVALAILTLLVWALVMTRKDPLITSETVVNAALVGIPSGIVFSRLLHVVDNIVVAKLHPELVASGAVIDYTQYPGQIIGGAGLAIYGAVLGAVLGIWVYSRFRKLPYGHLADVIAPGIILAQAIGRVGCTLNGCCYGSESDAFCAVVYTSPLTNAPINTPVLPTHIFEIIFDLLLFGALLLLRRRFRPDGSLFLVYLTAYSVWRFGIDFIREGTPFLFGLHEAQIISIVVLIVTITMMVRRTRWVKRGEEEVE